MVERIDIERALDKLAGDEAEFKFQSLAVVLAIAKFKGILIAVGSLGKPRQENVRIS